MSAPLPEVTDVYNIRGGFIITVVKKVINCRTVDKIWSGSFPFYDGCTGAI